MVRQLQRVFVRCASKGGKPKVRVQLLKDVPNVGAAGELLAVSPGFMRNYLHVDNKACYITKEHGPRIPVVERLVVVTPKEPKKKVEVKVEEAPTMTLEELSGLFSSMRSRSAKLSGELKAEASAEATYTVEEIESLIPKTVTISTTTAAGRPNRLPISKEDVSALVYELLGIQIPASAFTVGESDEITETGTYAWTIRSPDQKRVFQKTLEIVEPLVPLQ